MLFLSRAGIHSPEVTEDASAYDETTIFSSESDLTESFASGENQNSLFSSNQPVNTASPPEVNDSVVLNDNQASLFSSTQSDVID